MLPAGLSVSVCFVTLTDEIKWFRRISRLYFSAFQDIKGPDCKDDC